MSSAADIARQLQEEATNIIAGALSGQIDDPFTRIAVLIRGLFYPEFPSSTKTQLIVISAIYGVLLLGCIYTIWIRRRSLPLLRRIDGYLVPNTPILFAAFMGLFFAFGIVTVSRTIEIFRGERTFPGLYILRGICWTWLYLAAWFRGLGTLVEARFTSRMIQKSTGPTTTIKSTKLTSLFFTIFLPLIHVFWLLPLNGAVSALCDEAFKDWEKAYDLSLSLAEQQGDEGFSITAGVQQLQAPIEALTAASDRCITSQRALYGSLVAWIVLTILSLGGPAFFLMYKKIRAQAELHKRLDQDLQVITARQNVSLTISGNREKVQYMELAMQDLILQGFAFFGGSLSLLAVSLAICVLGIKAQINGNWLSALNLWAWYTLAVIGFPAIFSGIRTALVERDNPPFFLQPELNNNNAPTTPSGKMRDFEGKSGLSPSFVPTSWSTSPPPQSQTIYSASTTPDVADEVPYPSYHANSTHIPAETGTYHPQIPPQHLPEVSGSYGGAANKAYHSWGHQSASETSSSRSANPLNPSKYYR